MKAFFIDNPEIRKEDVIGATKMYIQNLDNPKYLITSHYFITKGLGKDRVSQLEEWVEKYKLYINSVPQITEASNFVANKMQ